MADRFDAAVIGGGIVGLATAWRLAERNFRVVVLEKEDSLAFHQSGHNSGVVHSGIYYTPGSAKARLAIRGARALKEFCSRYDVPFRTCGKLIVATSPEDLRRLDALESRALANGVEGVRRLSSNQIPEIETHATGLGAMFVASTGIVDFRAVALQLARLVTAAGGDIRVSTLVDRVRTRGDSAEMDTEGGVILARRVVGCAGLQSDRLALRSGAHPPVRIIPFRGEYRELVPARRHLVKSLIYPVPDPKFPFLGAHLTRTIHDSVEAGPTAALSFAREKYRTGAFDLRDTLDALRWPGFWRLARHWRIAAANLMSSLRSDAMCTALRRLVPEIQPDDLVPAVPGIRAQAVSRDGTLIDDFEIMEQPPFLHVLNAPSPAATASLAIGEELSARIARGI